MTHVELPARLVEDARAEEVEYFNTPPVLDIVKTRSAGTSQADLPFPPSGWMSIREIKRLTMSAAGLWHAKWAVARMMNCMHRRHRWRRSGYYSAKPRRAAGQEEASESSCSWTPGRHTLMPRWTGLLTSSCQLKLVGLVTAADSTDACTALDGRPPGGRRLTHRRWSGSAVLKAERLHAAFLIPHATSS